MNTATTTARPVIDVATLPSAELDHRASIWWGNLLLLAIETTMFALLIATYFYLQGNFQSWPPPQTNWAIARYNAYPSLRYGTLNLAIIALSCAPMLWADRSALRLKARATTWGLVICLLLGLLAIAFRFCEFFALNFRWDDNAYASTVWAILVLHLTHLMIGSLENGIMIAWILVHGMDAKHARDVRVNAVYWYWIGGIWVLLYGVVYLSARVF